MIPTPTLCPPPRQRIRSRFTPARVLVAGCLSLQLAVSGPLFAAPMPADGEIPAAPSPRLQLTAELAGLRVTPSKFTDGPQQAPAPPKPMLQIVILSGEGVSNNVKARDAREPIVQVQDENHKPVSGASVIFTIQSGSGHAGATFLNGAHVFSGVTDADGRIVAHGFTPNAHAGTFHIAVSASKGPLVTNASIAQANVIAVAGTVTTTTTIPAFVATHVVLVSVVAGAVAATGVSVGVAAALNNPGITVNTTTGSVGAPTAARVFRFGIRR